MQGIVTDEKGTKVKAAIVALLKVKGPDDESDAEIATYTETDEEGRFMIQDLNPDDKYYIEIHVEHAKIGEKIEEPVVEPESADELDPDDENFIIDSLYSNRTDESKSRNICVNNLYYISDTEQINKLYQMKKHLW